MPVDGIKTIITNDNSSRCYLLSIDYFLLIDNKNIMSIISYNSYINPMNYCSVPLRCCLRSSQCY